MPNYRFVLLDSSVLPLIGCYVNIRLYLDDINLPHCDFYIKYDWRFSLFYVFRLSVFMNGFFIFTSTFTNVEMVGGKI